MRNVAVQPRLNDRLRQRSLIAAIACVSIYSITTGFSLPLISLILENRGVGGTVNGMLAATPSLAMLMVTPFIPRMIVYAGMRRFLLACIVADMLLFLLLPLFDNLYAWFGIRFVMGATVAGLFVAGETWINEIADELSRGRTMGVYAMVVAGGFALGPLLLPVTGISGWVPFIVGSAIVALAALPLFWGRVHSPRFVADPAFTLIRFFVVAPTLCAAVLLAAFKDAAAMPLLPVYAVREGLDNGTAALMLTVLGIGAVSLQVPIGWLADRFDRYTLLMICAAGGALGAGSLPLVIHAGWILWVALFLWGGVFAGVYTTALVILGQRFRGAALATGNAAFGFFWGIGSMLGPAMAGPAMDLWNPHGLPATLCAATLVFLLLALIRRFTPWRTDG